MGRSYSSDVGDRILYAYTVEAEAQRLTLHTEFRALAAPEHRLLDVVFHDVLAHHFECVLPGNVLFDVEEVEARTVYEKHRALFERLKNYGWPPLEYDTPRDLFAKLAAAQIRTFDVASSCGLDGWVFAKRLELRPRTSLARAL